MATKKKLVSKYEEMKIGEVNKRIAEERARLISTGVKKLPPLEDILDKAFPVDKDLYRGYSVTTTHKKNFAKIQSGLKSLISKRMFQGENLQWEIGKELTTASNKTSSKLRLDVPKKDAIDLLNTLDPADREKYLITTVNESRILSDYLAGKLPSSVKSVCHVETQTTLGIRSAKITKKSSK